MRGLDGPLGRAEHLGRLPVAVPAEVRQHDRLALVVRSWSTALRTSSLRAAACTADSTSGSATGAKWPSRSWRRWRAVSDRHGVDGPGVGLRHQPRAQPAAGRVEAAGSPPQVGEHGLAHVLGQTRSLHTRLATAHTAPA